MKKNLLLFLLFFSIPIVAQNKKVATNGTIFFEASVPFFEAVEAKNNKVYSAINTKNGSIYFEVYISLFQFERSLMQDHFNTNYMESHKFPKSYFKGVIENFSINDLSTSPNQYYIKGRITIHGVSKNIRVTASVYKTTQSAIVIQSKFALNTDDFKIDIPSLVSNKISKTVNVTLYTNFH